MSMELCSVCDDVFDVDGSVHDIAMYEPSSICGICVQLVRDAYDEETAGYAEAKASAGELMKKFYNLIGDFTTKVTS